MKFTTPIAQVILSFLLLFLTYADVCGVAKTFSGTGNFSDAARWNGSTLPSAGDDLTINGTCTVDNSGTTDNVAYGNLVIGGSSAGTLNWVSSGTNRLNVANVSSSIAASALNMTNGGTLIIRGTWTSTNLSFTAGAGTIEVQSTLTLPSAYATYYKLTINNASGTATLGVGTTVSSSLTVTGNLQIVGYSITAGDLQGSGTIASSSGTPTLTAGSNNASTAFSGVIGSGAIALTKNGTGTLTLSGNNTFTGLTTIAAGTLKLGHSNALGTTAGATSVTSGAVLDLNGTTYSGSETLTLNGTGISTGGALINSNSPTATYAGNIALGSACRITANNPMVLSGVISGTYDLTTAGTSTLTLSGTNTNSGINTLVTGSTLKLANAAALGSTLAADYTVVGDGAQLDLNGTNYSSTEFLRLGSSVGGGILTNSSSTTATFAGKIDIYNGTATITADNPIVVSGQIASSSPGYTKNGSSTLTVTSANSSWGYVITVSAGTLVTGSTTALGSSASNAVTVNSGAVLDLNGYSNASARPLTLNGTGISNGGALINSSSTAATYSSNITLASASTVAGGTGTITLSGTITGAGYGLTLDGAAGGTVSGVIGGSGTTVTKNGAGVWILSGLNTYTGPTTVSGGFLRATNNTIVASTNGAFGNNASGLLLNGGTIESNVATFSRPITVTATNSGLDAYGSARTISATITNATGSSSFDLNVGGNTVSSAEGQNLTLSGVISNAAGTLSLTKVGTSLAIISAANTFSGGMTLSAGQLNLSHATAIGSGAFTATGGTLDNTSGGSITLSNNNAQNWNGDFTFVGTQPLNMGTGTVTISGSRQITVSGSTLTVGGTINSGSANLTKAGNGTLTFGSQTITLHDLTVNAGTLTATSGTMNLAGNFTNSATFNHNNGTVNFNGTSSQSVGVSPFYNLAVDNTAGLSLSQPVTVSNTITLTNGALNLNTKTLTISNSATTAIGRTNGYLVSEATDNASKVAWTIGTTAGAHVFPFAAQGDYIPFTLEVTAGDVGTVTVSTYHTNTANLPYPSSPTTVTTLPDLAGDPSANAADRFWQVDKTGPSGTVTVTFVVAGNETNSLEVMTAQRWNSATSQWDDPIAGQTNVLYGSTVTGVTVWGPWILVNPYELLPVEYVSFEAYENQGQVDVKWVTAREVNSDHFEVERSLDGGTYQQVAIRNGAGNSNTPQHYTATDSNPVSGTSYYRLRQVDNDGAETVTAAISVDFASSAKFAVLCYPNPTTDAIVHLQIIGASQKEVTIILRDINGILIQMERIVVTENGMHCDFNLKDGLAPGAYFIVATHGNEEAHATLMVR